MRFRAFRVDWDTLFFRKFSWARSVKRARAKRARCERVGPFDCIKVSYKNHFQLSYCSLEIVYAVKDCDSCGRAILSWCLKIGPTLREWKLFHSLGPYFWSRISLHRHELWGFFSVERFDWHFLGLILSFFFSIYLFNFPCNGNESLSNENQITSWKHYLVGHIWVHDYYHNYIENCPFLLFLFLYLCGRKD